MRVGDRTISMAASRCARAFHDAIPERMQAPAAAGADA
jgi:hypothetical protein